MARNNPYDKKKIIVCEDTGECVAGDKYLKTRHWQKLREEAYEYYGGVCQRCGDHIPLEFANIHHRVYNRMGKEKVTDLILYCAHCHACVHSGRKENKQTNRNLQSIINKLTPNERKEACEIISSHFGLGDDDEKSIDEKISQTRHKITTLRKELRRLQREEEQKRNKQHE